MSKGRLSTGPTLFYLCRVRMYFQETLPMQIGGFDIHCITTGTFALDGGAMFGVVPRPLWERHQPPDARNRITLAARSLLITGGTRRILVDTGNGTKFSQKNADIYRIDVAADGLTHGLALHGLAPSDITDVILTHLHFDHAGGSTRRLHDMVVPTFPNATYYVQKDHWDAALHPTERDRASFFPEDFLPLHEAGVLELLDGECELFPGIKLLLFHGHTPSLQLPLISDGSQTLFFCADLIPTVSHVPLPWIMGYDLRPLVTLEEKRSLLTTAAEEHWRLVFEHDPLVASATITTGEKGFTVRQESISPGPCQDMA